MSFLKNKITINILFLICIFFFMVSFFWSLFIHREDFRIPFLGKINAPLRVNVEIPRENAKNLQFFANGNEIEPYSLFDKNSYLIYETKNPVYYLYFKTDNKTLKSINNIVINLGKNLYYYNNEDILKFDKGRENEYILPFDIRYDKTSKYINDRGKITNFSVKFLSFFYNTGFYLTPLIWLFLAVLIYQKNKEKFSYNFNLVKNSAIWPILILGFILRLSDINISFWWDELYTSTIAGGVDEPFKRMLEDGWNPPLFFLLSKFWMMLCGNSEIVCRILTVLLSILSILMIYVFVNKNLNKNSALLASFLFSINVYAIHSSQEFRSYALQILLSLISAYYLFEIIRNKRNKDFILYGLIAAIMANVHYFQILFLINNFIFSLFYLDNKNKLKLLYSNLFAAFCFLPFFIMTGLNQGLIDGKVDQLPLYDLQSILLVILTYFGNGIVPAILFILGLVILFKKIREFIFDNNKQTFLIFVYSIYSVFALFVVAYIFSHIIKPIIKPYYFVSIIPFIVISIALVFYLPFKSKILKYGVWILILLNGIFCISNKGLYIDKDDMLLMRVEENIKYAYFDSKQFKKNEVGTLIPGYPEEFANYYKNFNSGLELIGYDYVDDYARNKAASLINIMNKSDKKIFYLMFHKALVYEYLKYFTEYYNLSLIETDREVFIGRLIKK